LKFDTSKAKNSLKRLLLKSYEWSSIRILGNSRIVKFTILVPIIGYLLLFNEYLLQYFKLSPEIFKAKTETSGIGWLTLWRLYVIYFGLCFFAGGSILYNLFCPQIIKRYERFSEFSGGESDYLPGRDLGRLYFIINNNLKKVSTATSTEINSLLSSLLLGLRKLERGRFLKHNFSQEEKNIILKAWYIFENMRNGVLRFFVFQFFLIGLILLAIPTIQTFFSILVSFYKNFNSLPL
jgi:hypothetical protein